MGCFGFAAGIIAGPLQPPVDDLDRYRNALADNRKARAEHWPVYEQLRAVLRDDDMELLKQIEGALRRIAGLDSSD